MDDETIWSRATAVFRETFDDDEDNGKAADIIEDASELGEDEDDVAKVVDNSRKGDET